MHEQQITQVYADTVKAVLGGSTESFVYFQKLHFLTYVYSLVHFLFWANRQHLNSSVFPSMCLHRQDLQLNMFA